MFSSKTSHKCFRESTREQRRGRSSTDLLWPPPRLFRAAPVVVGGGGDVAGPAGDQHDAAGAGEPNVLGRGGLDAEDELGGGGAGGRLGADFRAQGESRMKVQRSD